MWLNGDVDQVQRVYHV